MTGAGYPFMHTSVSRDQRLPIFDAEIVYGPLATLAGRRLDLHELFLDPHCYQMIVRHEGALWVIFDASAGFSFKMWVARQLTDDEQQALRDKINACIAPREVMQRRDEHLEAAEKVWREMCEELVRRIPDTFRVYAQYVDWVDEAGGVGSGLPEFMSELVTRSKRGFSVSMMIDADELACISGTSVDGLLGAAHELREAWTGVINVTAAKHPGSETVPAFVAINLKLP